MTATLEAPVAERERASGNRPHATFASKWKIAGRLARRQVRRTLLSSVLVSTLIMLPIAAMVAFAVVTMSMTPTAPERVTVELGKMQGWLAAKGVPDSRFFQSPIEPDWNGYQLNEGEDAPDGTPVSDPTAKLPAGTETIRVVETNVSVSTADRATSVHAFAGNVWDTRFTGRFDLIAGRAPAADDEAMVTPSTLKRLDIAIGDDITLADSNARFTVVGTLKGASLPDRTFTVFLPASADLEGDTRWYLPHLALTWPAIETMNKDGIVAFSRPVVLNPPTVVSPAVSMASDPESEAKWRTVLPLAMGGAFAGYVVVMLAGAAFAVAARRQQGTLAVAASVGARPADLRRVILLQGTVLGLAGGIAGLALGIGVAALVMRLISDGSATQFWGFHLPWEILGGILLFSLLVGTASAAIPARTVARSDTLSALRGARRPQVPRASRPIWGSIVLLVGVGLTLGAAFVTLATNSSELPWDSPLRTIPPFGIVIGAIVAQLGILLSGRWLLWLTAKALSRLGLSARLAARDASANASRTVPAFAAIAATVFLAVFAMGQTAMGTASNARSWGYQAPLGDLAVYLMPPEPATGGTASVSGEDPAGDAARAAREAIELAKSAGASRTAVLEKQPDVWSVMNIDDIPDTEMRMIPILPERYLLDPLKGVSHFGGQQMDSISVISADQIETALGVTLTAEQIDDYRNGAAIVTDDRFLSKGMVTIGSWQARDVYEGRSPNNVALPGPGAPKLVAPQSKTSIRALSLDLPHQPTLIAVTPSTADDLGLATRPYTVIARFDHPVPGTVRDRLEEPTSPSRNAWVFQARFEDGPPSDAVWLIPLLAAVAILVLGASSVALSLARFERRPDDATLAAVGGTRGLRRLIGFWQGLIIAGFGTFVGAAAGILSPIGFAIQSVGALRISDIPWLVIGLLAVGLPLAIALVSWLIPPRTPELARRTAIT